ncbi:MAG: hypothetical protein V3T23_12565 [Nitrososphaerales archaeon]
MKGLSEEQFQNWWNERAFFTRDQYHLLYSVYRPLLTEKNVDSTVFFIIKLAGDSKNFSNRLNVKLRPFPSDLEKKFKNLLAAQRELQASLRVPVEFRPTEAEITEAIDKAKKAREKFAPRRLPGVKFYLKSKDYKKFVRGLAVRDAFPKTKPTKHLQSFFICLLADHFRDKTGQSLLQFVGKIIEVCFGEKLLNKALRQRYRQFNEAVPTWPLLAKKIYAAANNYKFSLTDLPGFPPDEARIPSR